MSLLFHQTGYDASFYGSMTQANGQLSIHSCVSDRTIRAHSCRSFGSAVLVAVALVVACVVLGHSAVSKSTAPLSTQLLVARPGVIPSLSTTAKNSHHWGAIPRTRTPDSGRSRSPTSDHISASAHLDITPRGPGSGGESLAFNSKAMYRPIPQPTIDGTVLWSSWAWLVLLAAVSFGGLAWNFLAKGGNADEHRLRCDGTRQRAYHHFPTLVPVRDVPVGAPQALMAVTSRRRLLMGAGVGVGVCGCACCTGLPADAMATLTQPDPKARAAFDTPRDPQLDAAFARGMDTGPKGLRGGMADIERAIAPRKAALFAALFADLGPEPTVLEVGAGTLPNARFYAQYAPPGLDLIGMDPNDFMGPRFEANARLNGLPPARFVHGVAEALPLADGAADAVVCTLTLCSVPDPARSLAEMRRVLRPGGKLLFLEHVLSEDDPRLAAYQEEHNAEQVARADGCHLNRRTLLAVQTEFGAANVQGENYTFGSPAEGYPLGPLSSQCAGIARKV